jgi:hypothetical protein
MTIETALTSWLAKRRGQHQEQNADSWRQGSGGCRLDTTLCDVAFVSRKRLQLFTISTGQTSLCLSLSLLHIAFALLIVPPCRPYSACIDYTRCPPQVIWAEG